MRAPSSHENSTVLKMLYFKIEAVSPLAQLTFDDHNDTCLFRSHNISEPSTRVRRCRGGIVSKWVSESEMEKRRGWLKFMFSHLILRLLNSNTDFDDDAIFRIPYSVSRLERKPDCVFFFVVFIGNCVIKQRNCETGAKISLSVPSVFFWLSSCVRSPRYCLITEQIIGNEARKSVRASKRDGEANWRETTTEAKVDGNEWQIKIYTFFLSKKKLELTVFSF